MIKKFAPMNHDLVAAAGVCVHDTKSLTPLSHQLKWMAGTTSCKVFSSVYLALSGQTVSIHTGRP